MKPFVSSEQMLALDRELILAQKIQSFDLMMRVAQAMSEVLLSRFRSESFHILCGPGNNGGDGYCLAHFLSKAGREVSVESLLPPQTEEAKRARDLLPAGLFRSPTRTKTVLVDAIFGLQARKALSPALSEQIRQAIRKPFFKVSLDLATPGFSADLTLTVAYPKISFLEPLERERLGEIVYVAEFFPKTNSSIYAIEIGDFQLPRRPRTSHKGRFGKLGVVGGSASMPGASVLAAEAGARIGAGYSTLFFSKGSQTKLRVKDASFIFKSRWTMKDILSQTALVVGCGGKPGARFKVLKLQTPMVLDASALSEASAADLKSWRKSKCPILLTPHPGEAAKLLKTSPQKVEADRMGALDELVKLTGQSVYLKGSPALLKFKGDSKTYVNLSAVPAFATAGSGDTLSGILGGILAQGSLGFEESVISGIAFHQALGTLLQNVEGSISSDQLTLFSETFKKLRISCAG